MNERADAAAKAIHNEFCREDWHAGHVIGQACYDMKTEAANILAAADAVMFSDEAIDRVAAAIAAAFAPATKWEDHVPQAQETYRNQVRAIIAAFKGAEDE